MLVFYQSSEAIEVKTNTKLILGSYAIVIENTY